MLILRIPRELVYEGRLKFWRSFTYFDPLKICFPFQFSQLVTYVYVCEQPTSARVNPSLMVDVFDRPVVITRH